MPLNKDVNVQKAVQFSKILAKKIEELAQENHRSFSAQVLYMVEQYLKMTNKEN